MRKRLSPGVVLGLVAVVFAMSGSAYAASTITSAQIKDGTITTKDIKDRSISGRDIADVSLSADKLTDAALEDLKGAAGPAGPAGPAGAAGPAGPSAVGGITIYTSAQIGFGSTDIAKAATAYCPAGQRVISGGGVSISDEQLAASQATADRTGWYVIGVDAYDNGGEYVQAQALCAPAGVAVASSAGHAAAESEVAAALKKIKTQVKDKK